MKFPETLRKGRGKLVLELAAQAILMLAFIAVMVGVGILVVEKQTSAMEECARCKVTNVQTKLDCPPYDICGYLPLLSMAAMGSAAIALVVFSANR